MFRINEISLAGKLKAQSSLATAVKVNFLNPGPYLFWFTVGGNYIVRGSTAESLVFVITSIGALIVSKVTVAVLAVRFFPSLEGRGYLTNDEIPGLHIGLVWPYVHRESGSTWRSLCRHLSYFVGQQASEAFTCDRSSRSGNHEVVSGST